MDEQAGGRPLIEWGFAGRPFPGESESGDLHFVRLSASRVLVGVIDGLGHGTAAAVAAKAAVDVIDSFAHEPIVSLFSRCHEHLQSTRGVVMTIVAFENDTGTMEWLGVGNVKAVLRRAQPSAHSTCSDLIVRGGIVGLHQLPPLRTSEMTLSRGDTLVLATDGIDQGFLRDLTVSDDPQDLADRLLKDHQRSTDDSLVLVVRYRGG